MQNFSMCVYVLENDAVIQKFDPRIWVSDAETAKML